jgi:NodT family efflux transporter outer membrane factor (OMF) lipoprotein
MTPFRQVPALASLLLGACGLSACLVGPNYQRPPVTSPPAFKEADGWAPAQPSDAADKTDWWTAFGDPVLNGLEERVNVSNQTLAADAAAYQASHAMVAEDRAALFPTVTVGASANRSYTGGGAAASKYASSTGGTATTTPAGTHGSTSIVYEPTVGATWAPDLWGSVRRTIRSAKATAQADAATLANARLSIQTELATDYISLRQYDEDARVYAREVAAYERSLKVVQNQYAAGNAAKSAVLTAETTLDSAKANQADLIRQRSLMEHAIAVLVGVAPADLTIAPAPWSLKLPALPTVLPSTLLQRRPDIAAAERSAAAASELIGVQVAAYYPTISLSASGGFESDQVKNLFNASNALWSIGASATETVFDGGLRGARVRQYRAQYNEAVATYRQTALTAFQNVEDNLAAQRVYGSELALDEASARAAAENQTITLNEYTAGTVDYTTVAAAEAQALSTEITRVQIESSRLATAVALIEALGGGWTTNQLPRS